METEIEIEIDDQEFIKKSNMKSTRNLLLQETDKFLFPDYPITPEQLGIIKTYRQALRDFTKNDYIMPDRDLIL